MGHGHDHNGHHHHGRHQSEERSYGAYAGSSYAPPPQLAYGQQPVGYGGYGAAPPAPYGAVQPYGGYGSAQPYGGAMQPYQQQSQMQHLNDLRADEQRHKHNEHRAEAVGLGAAAFAAYEHHQVKVDPEHAQRHHVEERLAEATAVGAAGYALYEHKQSRHDHKVIQQEQSHDHHRGHKHDKHHRHHGN